MKNVKYLIILALSLFSLQAYSQGYKIVLKDGRAASVRADITKVITFSQSANTKAGAVPGYEISLKDGRSVVIGVEETESFTFSTDASLMTDISALEEPEHEYVDLGLSVKWATMNVGATEVAGSKINAHTGQLDCYGEYYAWGETSPKDDYRWGNYTFYTMTSMTKYCTNSSYDTVDNKTVLEPEDDAATVNWGKGWRMPTNAELDELRTKCTWTWTTLNGVNGYKVSASNGKSIFLPASGFRYDSGVFSLVGDDGLYWSNSLFTDDSQEAYFLYFSTDEVNRYGNTRYCGSPIRPVYLSPSDVVSVSSISLSNSSLSMTEGDIETLTATVAPSNATNQVLVWTSSDNSVATVNYEGVVTAFSAGSATITATAADGSGVKATCSVTVEALAPAEPEAVDLGLSVKWANMNLGAHEVAGSKFNVRTGQLDCYGECYAWGETSPKDSYNWSTYTLCNGSSETMTKYCTYSYSGTVDNKATLELSDDAARANWGDSWRMPTYAELNELRTKCTWTWTTMNGVNGYKVSASNGNSIFLPAAGSRGDSRFDDVGSKGIYWSGSLDPYNSYQAGYLGFNSSNVDWRYCQRYFGLSIRPVYSTQPATVAVSSITLSNSSLSMTEGDTETLTATVSPSDATNKGITWTSSNESVAKVSTAGVVTAVSAGSATITATAADGSGVKATCTVTVEAQASAEPEAVDLGLSVKWANMNVGATEVAGSKINAHTGQLACYGEYYAWGETSPKDDYSWETYTLCNGSRTSITKYCLHSTFGTVDNKSVLDPEDDAATANWGSDWRMPTMAEQDELRNNCYWEYTASYNNSGVKGYIVYKVKDAADKGVKKYRDSSTTTSASYSLSDAHIFLPAAGARIFRTFGDVEDYGYYLANSISSSTDAYQFYFSKSIVDRFTIIRVNGQSIRPVYSSQPAAVAVSSITLSNSSISMTEGDTETLTATVSPSDATNKGITWTSSNESVVKVSNSGAVTAVSIGTATITATAADGSGVKATCDVTVVAQAQEHNGHEYVDLGVSVKWATMNVGATEVAGSKTNSHTGQLDCYGEYYAWGETTPKDSYGLSNYKYSTDDDNTYTKYVASSEWGTVDNKTVLDSEDDAATANWGGKWRTPSQAEQQELLDNCYWVYTASYNNSGVKGFIVYKAKDASDKGKYPTYDEASDSFVTPAAPVASYSLSDAHIFLPAAGLRKDSDFEDVTSCGYYWSSSLCQSTTYSAFMTYLYESNCILPLEENRDKGRSVRAVCP